MLKQRTLKNPIQFSGVGLHSGRVVRVEVRPALPNTGILFQRVDLPGLPYIHAHPDNILATRLATEIGNGAVSIATTEHLMAALFGLGIDNAVVALDAPELPIMDGSAAPFLVLLDEAGVTELSALKKLFIVKKPVEVVDPSDATRFIRIEPSHKPSISYMIDFGKQSNSIGQQFFSLELSGESFCEECAFARTFCLAEEVEAMRSRGLARGGSLANAVVVSGQTGVVNSQGLRDAQEFVRHKILDCIGDLYLLGALPLGHVIASKAGHDLHVQLVRELYKNRLDHQWVEDDNAALASAWAWLRFPISLSDVRRSLAGLAIG